MFLSECIPHPPHSGASETAGMHLFFFADTPSSSNDCLIYTGRWRSILQNRALARAWVTSTEYIYVSVKLTALLNHICAASRSTPAGNCMLDSNNFMWHSTEVQESSEQVWRYACGRRQEARKWMLVCCHRDKLRCMTSPSVFEAFKAVEGDQNCRWRQRKNVFEYVKSMVLTWKF